MRKIISTAAAVLMLASPIIVSARAPSDLSDLAGMRASSFDGVMGDRGYQFIKSKGLTQFWWNPNSKACVSAVTSNGRISVIQTATLRDCGKAGGSSSGGNASSGNGLGGLNGMDSIKAIDVMSSRGFTNVDTITTPNTLYGIFFNPRTRVCAQLTMADQKVLHVDSITHPKCR